MLRSKELVGVSPTSVGFRTEDEICYLNVIILVSHAPTRFLRGIEHGWDPFLRPFSLLPFPNERNEVYPRTILAKWNSSINCESGWNLRDRGRGAILFWLFRAVVQCQSRLECFAERGRWKEAYLSPTTCAYMMTSRRGNRVSETSANQPEFSSIKERKETSGLRERG